MCGIAGCLYRTPRVSAGSLAQIGARMADRVSHRGPDDSGVWVDAAAGVALAHRRLSIQDLSHEGAQPMRSACGRWVVVYNGEVYEFGALRKELEGLGHTFRGHSDTEVLLAAVVEWGVDGALERLSGMFALALWDRERRELHLVRDRVGKKPIYYGWCGDVLLFGSELKALRAHPEFRAEVDRDALGVFVQHSYLPAPRCIYRGLRKLPPASIVTLAAGRSASQAAPRTFWSAREVAERGARAPFAGSAEDAANELDALLHEAVRSRMISDVPLGALLSGGIDSSTVVSIMQDQSNVPVRTFSIGFDEDEYDEAPHARAIAKYLGTEHTELSVRPDDALELIPRLPTLYDEPFADVSQIPTFIVCALARRQVTVALSGDGGDELFAGYKRYFRCLRSFAKRQGVPLPLRRLSGRAQRGVARALWRIAGDSDTPGEGGWRREAGRIDRRAGWNEARTAPELFARMHYRTQTPLDLVVGASAGTTVYGEPDSWPDVEDPLQTMMFMDFSCYLPEDVLVKVDRASMGVSLEVRAPLLDHRVVEFAWSLPIALRADQEGGKRPLHHVLSRYLPTPLFDRPKMGFGVPVAEWLKGPLREWAEALLAPARLRDEGFLSPDAVRDVWRQHLVGWRDHHMLLWSLLMFQAWLEEARS